MYFKQYLYKLELMAYGGRSINSKNGIQQNINQRLASHKHINYGGSWYSHNIYNSLQKSDIEWLEFLKTQKMSLAPNLRTRTEEPKIQVYADNEDDLLEFANRIPKQYRKYILSVHKPETDRELELLKTGVELRRKPPKYRYKIHFKDGNYSAESKMSIFNYLQGLDDQVWMPVRCQDQLTKTHNYIWDTYMFANDVNITIFLRIINPDLIRSITELASTAEINTDNKEI